MALVGLVYVDAAQVERGLLYYPSISAFTSEGVRDGQLIEFSGRAAPNDGCGGLFTYSQTSTATVDGGVVFAPVTGPGRLIRTIRTANSESQASEAYNVRWWGALGDGAHDDTANILSAYNYVKNTTLFYTLRFPAGRYVTTSSFVFQDITAGSFLMEGCVFIGASTGADNSQQAVFEIRNCVNASISGPWSITAMPLSGPTVGNPNAYISGLLVRAVPGGVLQPTAGVCAFLNVSDLTTIRIGNGIRVGEVGNDAQTSEMVFTNCKTLGTVNPLFMGGSQTLVSMNNCTLTSNPVAGIYNAARSTIVQDGGALTINGGNVEMHSGTDSFMVLMRPANSVPYDNTYGHIVINGAVIESESPLLAITNQFGFTNPRSDMSRFVISNCTGGYVGGVPITSSLLNVFDTTYAGTIVVGEGACFYSLPGSPARTWNVNASGNNKVRISVGKSSFDTNSGFLGYPYGVYGGVLLHAEVLGTAANVVNQNVAAGTDTVMVFSNNPPDTVRTGRYQYILNTSTGAVTVPDAGIRRIRIEANAVIGSGSNTGNIWLARNGVLYKYGVFSGGTGSLECTIPDPVPGESLTVHLLSTQAGTLTGTSKLCVYLET